MDYSNLRRQAASMKKSLFDQACILKGFLYHQYMLMLSQAVAERRWGHTGLRPPFAMENLH